MQWSRAFSLVCIIKNMILDSNIGLLGEGFSLCLEVCDSVNKIDFVNIDPKHEVTILNIPISEGDNKFLYAMN